MLNYYHLLKISDLCNDAEVITMAYRRAIAEKAHGNESDDGFRERICCVTEAYLVLSDMLLKNRYDHALSEGTPLDDDLSQHIAAKRSEAEAFVPARHEDGKRPIIDPGHVGARYADIRGFRGHLKGQGGIDGHIVADVDRLIAAELEVDLAFPFRLQR